MSFMWIESKLENRSGYKPLSKACSLALKNTFRKMNLFINFEYIRALIYLESAIWANFTEMP